MAVSIFTSLLIPFALLGINEAIIKPIAIKITRYSVSEYLRPAWDSLDAKLQLPDQWRGFVDKGADWVFSTVVEETAPALSDKDKRFIANLLVKEFDLKAFLGKVDSLS